MTGWLRNHVGDGMITILIDGRASFVRLAELVDLAANRLIRGATVRDVYGEYHGLVRPSVDRSRHWVDLNSGLSFVWAEDLDAVLAGERASVEIHPVYGGEASS